MCRVVCSVRNKRTTPNLGKDGAGVVPPSYDPIMTPSDSYGYFNNTHFVHINDIDVYRKAGMKKCTFISLFAVSHKNHFHRGLLTEGIEKQCAPRNTYFWRSSQRLLVELGVLSVLVDVSLFSPVPDLFSPFFFYMHCINTLH